MLTPYSANELFEWLKHKEDMLVLDVRNEEDFSRFKVESPYPMDLLNIPYFDFMEEEDESVAKVPRDKKVRVVCAKEGSAQYVGEILESHGFEDVGYLTSGIVSWGNMLAPVRINPESDNYELWQFIRPGKASLNYGVISDGELTIFDPSRNLDYYQQFAEEHGCKVTQTFETHLQADYISGSRFLAEAHGAVIHAHSGDFMGAAFDYVSVEDGQRYQTSANGPEIEIVHTPGHTPGSTCFKLDGKYLISGDTVFIVSLGRPDLGGKAVEWAGMLYETVTEKIKKMDPALTVLPGHYIDWAEADDNLVFADSLGNILKSNADIYDMPTEVDFIQFIKDNIRKQPDVYAEIRKVNAGWLLPADDEQSTMDLGKNECAASAYAAQQAS
jgi:glyoxylase-like metal-dependent hydrolase (beta-lactamase superfamily II)/rhodanese-related sulfurtransferase